MLLLLLLMLRLLVLRLLLLAAIAHVLLDGFSVRCFCSKLCLLFDVLRYRHIPTVITILIPPWPHVEIRW